MCKKIKFTKSQAILALRKIKKRGGKNRHEQRYYWCNEHKAYHLTSQKFRVKTNRKGLSLDESPKIGVTLKLNPNFTLKNT